MPFSFAAVSVIISTLCIGLLAAALLTPKLSGGGVDASRLGCIDGLRGYMAMFVVCHHFLVITWFLQTGVWKSPSDVVGANLAPAGVSTFFMITAFLFYPRAVEGKCPSLLGLYIGRTFRISPMYYVLVVLCALAVAFQNGLSKIGGPKSVAVTALHWATFTVFKDPAFDGDPKPLQMAAGVIWTLRYEWLFYLGLPVIWTLSRNKPPLLRIAALCAVSLSLILAPDVSFHWLHTRMLIPFTLGMISSEMVRYPGIRVALGHWLAALLAIVALVSALLLQGQPYAPTRCLLIALFFIPIAGGNRLFGLVDSRASCALGDISYSVYLLHGIVLYAVLSGWRACFGLPSIPWLLLPVAAVGIVFMARLGYVYVEMPAIRLGKTFLRSWWGQRPQLSEVAP